MDYKTLITSEHRIQPKFMMWLTAATDMIEDVQKFLGSLYLQYDLDRAVGAQLDNIGERLGMPRRLPFQPSNGVSPIMPDSNYRLVLRAVIAESHFDGKIPSLYDLFQTVLGDTGLYFVVIDNQDMSVSVIVYGQTDSLIKDELEYGLIVPKSEGVAISINVTANKIFAWGLNNDIFSGWGTGSWLIRSFSPGESPYTPIDFQLLDAGGSSDEERLILSAGDSSADDRVLLEGNGSHAV